MMEGGWPLGLQLLNARNLELELSRSSSLLSFSTMFTSTFPASSSSSFSSESTKTSYFHERRRRGVTLRSLLNTTTPSTLHFSISSSTSSPPPQPPERHQLEIGGLKKSHVTTHKPKSSWLHSLCSKPVSHDIDDTTTTRKAQLSLGYLLEQERVMSIRRGLECSFL